MSAPVPQSAGHAGDTQYTVWLTDAARVADGKGQADASWRLQWGVTARFLAYTGITGKRWFRDEPVLMASGAESEPIEQDAAQRKLQTFLKVTQVYRRTGPATRPLEPEPERYEWDFVLTAAPAGTALDNSSPLPGNARNLVFRLIVDANGQTEYHRLTTSAGRGILEYDGPEGLMELHLMGPMGTR